MAINSAAKYFLSLQQENPGLNKTITMLEVENLKVIMAENLIECTEGGKVLIQSFDGVEISEECQQIIAEVGAEKPKQFDAQLKKQTSDFLQMRELKKQTSNFVQMRGVVQRQFSDERNNSIFVFEDY